MDKTIPPMAEKVYAVIYWYDKLKDGYCHASNATIAKNIGSTNSASVSRAIAVLIEGGYVAGEYDPVSGDRLALIPLVHLAKGGIPNGKGPLYQMANDNKNNIEKKSYVVDFNSETFDDPVHRLYKGWLIEMVIGARKWLGTTDLSARVALLEAAARKTSLTPKRYQKMSLRVGELGIDSCVKAIQKIAQSEWHRGENDNKWKATIEWLFGSREKTEEWS